MNKLVSNGTAFEAPHGMKYVYVLESGTGLVKIGVSGNFERRKRALETQSGFEMVHTAVSAPVVNYSRIEKEMHENFGDARCNGEWFMISFPLAVKHLDELLKDHGSFVACDIKVPAGKVKFNAAEDSVAVFVEECCTQAPGSRIGARELHNAYQQWMIDRGEKAHILSERDVTQRLKVMGYRQTKPGNKKTWIGLSIDSVPETGGYIHTDTDAPTYGTGC